MLDAERFLRETIPFNALPEKEITRIAHNLIVKVFLKDEVIFKEGDPPLDFLYVVRSGSVVLKKDNATLEYLHEGESFGFLSLISSSPPASTAVAQEDCVVFLTPKKIFDHLVREYPDFGHYFTKALANRLQKVSVKKENTTLDKFSNVTVNQLLVKEPLVLDKKSTVNQAVKLMVAQDYTYTLVRLNDHYGIVTERDILKKVLAKGLDPETVTLEEIATYPIVGVDSNALVIDAMLLMGKHGIRKIAVFEGNRPIGVLEDRNIIAFESKNLIFMVKEIEKAKTTQELSYLFQLVKETALEMVLNDTDPERIGKYISEFNDKFMKRAVYITIQRLGQEPIVPFSIMVLGSEGRMEQSLNTDQDNALVYEDIPMLDIDVKEYFKEFSKEYIKVLLEIGFPPCPGNVMVSNPYWRRSFQDWEREILSWVDKPDPDNVLNMSIFFDFRNIFGSSALVERLFNVVFDRISHNKMFLPFLAVQAVKFKPPIGFFGNLVVEKAGEHKGAFDIKKGGIFPIVQGVRVLSLEHRVKESNTFDRIKALERLNVLSKEFSRDLQESYRFLSRLRLKSQAIQIKEGKNPDNYIKPDSLNKTEKTLLKDVFKMVENFQDFLHERYNLRYFAR